MFGLSKKERLETEIQRVRDVVSALDVIKDSLSVLKDKFPQEEELSVLRDRINTLLDQVIDLEWARFNVKDLTENRFRLNENFAVDELHNQKVWDEEEGFIKALRDLQVTLAVEFSKLTGFADTLRNTPQDRDPAGFHSALGEYSKLISKIQDLISSVIEDLTDGLRGRNEVFCGLTIPREFKRASAIKRWGQGLAIVGALAGFGGTVAHPTIRHQAASMVANPLGHLRVAALGLTDLEKLQEYVDQINRKIRKKQPLDEADIDFLKALYQDIATSGLLKDLHLSSKLLNHYVNGGGEHLEIDSIEYRRCKAVQEAMEEMSEYVQTNYQDTEFPQEGDLTSVQVLKGKYKSPDQDLNDSGIMRNGGIKAGKNDTRDLFYSDRRFALRAHYTVKSDKISIRWSVKSVYDFERGNKSTPIPIPGQGTLQLPHRISRAIAVENRSLTPFGAEFAHTATWWTTLKIFQPEVEEAPEIDQAPEGQGPSSLLSRLNIFQQENKPGSQAPPEVKKQKRS